MLSDATNWPSSEPQLSPQPWASAHELFRGTMYALVNVASATSLSIMPFLNALALTVVVFTRLIGPT